MKLTRARSVLFLPDPALLNSGDEIISPTPTKNSIPDWYRESEFTYQEDPDSSPTSGLKTCVPFLDTLLTGYYIRLQNDLVVENSSGQKVITWRGSIPLVKERSRQSGSRIPRPAGYADNHLVWNGMWGVKVPRGYSALLCHPINRLELPFTTMAGVIDADRMHAWGNLPFFLRADFTGVIPRGTPIIQVIPFKRDAWSSTIAKGLSTRGARQGAKCRSVERGFYKENYWSRKDFS